MNPLTEEEQKIHTEANNCKLCGNCFEHDKVRHHDHITGCYIGPYCNRCNLQLKFRKRRNDKKRKSAPFNHGERNKFWGDTNIIPDDAEVDELDPFEFEMNADNFMLSVFFHNLKGFDSHMSYIDKNFASSDLQVIPTTSEMYIYFQIGNLRFSDLLQFLNALLESLVQSLSKDGVDKFQQTQRHFPGSDLVFQKGIYRRENNFAIT